MLVLVGALEPQRLAGEHPFRWDGRRRERCDHSTCNCARRVAIAVARDGLPHRGFEVVEMSRRAPQREWDSVVCNDAGAVAELLNGFGNRRCKWKVCRYFKHASRVA